MSTPSTDSVVASNATLRLISKEFKFTEGPAADKAGNVYFTDQPNDRIWKYGVDGQLTIFMEKTGRSNGLYIDNKDNIISCADQNNELWKIAPDKTVTVLLSKVNGQYLNGPNDLWIDPKGGIYFTDPLYKRPYWEEGRTHIPGEKVYYLAKGKTEAVVVNDEFVKPNGIIGTPDGRTLYVADIGDNKTYRFDIRGDGMLTNKTLLINQGSDGMTIDNRGNIYLTGKGVTVYNSAGQKITSINVPVNWTANVCFGGPQRDKLYITASDSFYELQMNTRGAQ